jgi:protein SCO1/2
MRKSKYAFCLLLALFFACTSPQKNKRILPIYGEREINVHTVNGKKQIDTLFHAVPPFSYLNQDSVTVTQAKVKNTVYLAYFFFTSCPSICPKMTAQMKRLQQNTKDIRNNYHILSFTINPTIDSPAAFRRYIHHFDLDMGNWDMLTGDEKSINQLGIKGFLVHSGKDDYAEGGYAHSTAFVLVDKAGMIRGLYDGTDAVKVNELEKDLRKLILSYEKANRDRN